jgi:hypothetical protein
MTDTALTPDTAQVGDGATRNGWSDRQSYTIVDVLRNGKQIVLQRDNAVRSNQEDDSFSPGGFAGHVSHGRGGQQWLITPDTDAGTIKANWSAKRNRFFVGGPKGNSVTAGRHEFYDYNF